MPSFQPIHIDDDGDHDDSTLDKQSPRHEVLAPSSGTTALPRKTNHPTHNSKKRTPNDERNEWSNQREDQSTATDTAVATAQTPPQQSSSSSSSSRIAGILPYQRYLQRLDPSLPQYYTRKEIKVMNDETPDKGEEPSPSMFQQSSHENGAEASGEQENASQPNASYPPRALFAVGQNHHAESQDFETQPFSSQEQKEPIELKVPLSNGSLPTIPEGALPNSEDTNDNNNQAKDNTEDHLDLNDNNVSKKTGPVPNQTLKGKEDETEPSDSRNASQNKNENGTGPQPCTDLIESGSHAELRVHEQASFRLYFVERGRDMHKDILVGPKRNAQTRGAIVLDHFNKREKDSSKLPTHFVVGTVASPEVICRALGFDSINDLRHFMYQHKIQCATKAWASKVSTKPYQAPRNALTLQHLRVPYQEIYAPLTPLRPPNPTAATTKGGETNQTYGSGAAVVASPPRPERNVALSQIFKKLSKAYQEAPLDPIDSWRAYSFATAASRLRALPFEIDSKESLQRAKKIKGFGSSTFAIMYEFVEQKLEDDGEEESMTDKESGEQFTIRRLQDLRTDPQRQAVRTMMNIWGVGRAKALELVQAGYTTIEEIRRDFEQNCLRVTLQRNQYIGLLCYDDILDEMDRSEAECIANIIKEAVQEYYSEAEVQIMGSYRRGNETCGDVDILMVHPKYHHKVPPKALGRIIDRLCAQGHVAYNLTQLPGMDSDNFETLSRDTAKRLGRPGIMRPKRDKEGCSSYMGIFHSPCGGKKRRVDIKFYPYRERVFASLYFTGNGYFNRSMRLWSRRKFGYTLNDHGMFQEGSQDVRVMDAMNEEQVFRRLRLVWKEPNERDGFDAVIGLDSKRAIDLEAWSAEEFRREEGGHTWIK